LTNLRDRAVDLETCVAQTRTTSTAKRALPSRIKATTTTQP
jgi:hypothetical protein